MSIKVSSTAVADGAPPPASGKTVYWIRHGEGHHNVAQREWRADPQWDGVSEPYTLDNDGGMRYADATLTPKGEEQARSLQQQVAGLAPELLIVSPMRRATQTGLLAFQQHVQSGGLKALALELCHERAGRHTCDKVALPCRSPQPCRVRLAVTAPHTNVRVERAAKK